MAGYDRHTESVYGKFAAMKITHALYSTRFCCMCLGSMDKLYLLDSSGAGEDEEDSNFRAHTRRSMIEEVFGDAINYILFSDHVCSPCTKSVRKAFTFIQQTKANAKIFTEYFNTLHKMTIELLQLNNAEDISKVLFNLSFNLNNVGNHEKERLHELKHTEEQKTGVRPEMAKNETVEGKETRFENGVLNSEETKDKNKCECETEMTEKIKLTEEKESEKTAEINITEEREVEKTAVINVTEELKETEKIKDKNLTEEIEVVEKPAETNVPKEIEEAKKTTEIVVLEELKEAEIIEEINITEKVKEAEKTDKMDTTQDKPEKTAEINMTEKIEGTEKTEDINIIGEIAVTRVLKKRSQYQYTYEIEMTEDIVVKDELEYTEETETTNEKEASEEVQFVSYIPSDVSFSKETEITNIVGIMEEIDLTEPIPQPEVTNEIETSEQNELKKQPENQERELTREKTVPVETPTKEIEVNQKTKILGQPEVVQAKEITKETEKIVETQVEKEKYLIDETEGTTVTEVRNKTKVMEIPDVHGIKQGTEVTKKITIVEDLKVTDEIGVLKLTEGKEVLEKTEITNRNELLDETEETELTEVTKEKILEETEKIKVLEKTAEIDVLENTKRIDEREALEDEDVVEVLQKTEIIEEIEILDSDTEITEETVETDNFEVVAKIMDVLNETELIEEIEILDSDTEITEETEEIEALDETETLNELKQTKLTKEIEVLQKTKVTEVTKVTEEKEILEEMREMELLEETFDSDTEITEETEEIEALDETETFNVLKQTKLTKEIEVLQKTKVSEVTKVIEEKEILEEMGEIELLEEFLDSDNDIYEETNAIKKNGLSEKIMGGTELETNKENEVNNKTKSTESVNGQRRGYECGTCNRIYWLKSWFSLHLKTKGHIAKTKVPCPQCVNRPCKHEKYLLAYEQQKGNKMIKCPLCKDLLYNLNELIAHVNENHLKNKSVICDICNREFSLKSQLITHLMKHNPKVKCTSCSRVFGSDAFKKHQSKCQNATEPVKCAKCPALFINIEAYLEHKREHLELDIQNMIPVKILANTDTEITNVRDIKRNRKRKDYGCPICRYKCRPGDELSKHLKSMHSAENKRTCSVCAKIFDSRQQYLDHRKTNKHFERDNETRGLKRLYCCDYCDYSIKRRNNLVAHIKRHHLKMMPYECPICKEKFLDERHLNLHLNKHSSKEKRVCNICGKVLVSNSIINHMRRHTGESSYASQKCTNKSTSSSGRSLDVSKVPKGKIVASLRSHTKKHWNSKGDKDFNHLEGNHDNVKHVLRDKRKVF